MTTSAYFTKAKLLRRLHEGPLGIHIDLYAARLQQEGHCQQSAWRCLRVVGDFSRWLARRQLGLSDVNEGMVDRYQRFRSRYRCPFLSDRPALNRLLTVLRQISAIPAKPPLSLSAHEQIEGDFRRYLFQECGLAHVSVIRHLPVVRQFLREKCPDGVRSFAGLARTDILEFVERHVHDHSPQSAQIMCWTLRAFTRFLLYRDHVSEDIADCVPAVRRWKLTSIPTYLSAKQIKQILDSCDRSSAIGQRDYAILLLLARLGLRANEITTLTLDDIDWETGQLTIQGKGRKEAQLPLPSDVGAAVATYLQDGRPNSSSRRVFLRHWAPHVGFATSATVSVIATTAITRAKLNVTPHKGAHLFRHSLATQLLRAGASLTEIGQVLRHQDHDTTRIYAKVDIDALRALGLPWPGGTQ